MERWLLFSSPPVETINIEQKLPKFTSEISTSGYSVEIFTTSEGDRCRYHFIFGLPRSGDVQSVSNVVHELLSNSPGINRWPGPTYQNLLETLHESTGGRRARFHSKSSNNQDTASLPTPSTSLPKASDPVVSHIVDRYGTPMPAAFVAINATAPMPSLPSPATLNVADPMEIDKVNRTSAADNNKRTSKQQSGPVPNTNLQNNGSREDRGTDNVDQANPPADEVEDDYYDAEEQSESEGADANGDSTLEFMTKQKLNDSLVFKRNMRDIMSLLETPYLDLNPDYQREVVWTSVRMTALIDSIMENYYIPPVIFNTFSVESHDTGKGKRLTKRVCVDGKQRISSVQAFMTGQIPCHDAKGRDWYFCDKPNDKSRRRRRILSEKSKKEFEKKEFVCYEFKSLQKEQEEELFSRVQKGMPLTPAEKMRATDGPWQNLAKEFEKTYDEIVNLTVNSRHSGFRNILTCFAQITEIQYPTNPDGEPVIRMFSGSIDAFVRSAVPDQQMRNHLKSVFQTFRQVLRKFPQTFENNGYRHAKRFAPVEVVGVACLISMYHDSRNFKLLSGDILALRNVLRKNMTDLRLNGTTWKVIWEFISNLEQYRGAVDGSTVPVRGFTPMSTPTKAERKRGLINSAEKPVSKLSFEHYRPGPSSPILSRAVQATNSAPKQHTPPVVDVPPRTEYQQYRTQLFQAAGQTSTNAPPPSQCQPAIPSSEQNVVPIVTQQPQVSQSAPPAKPADRGPKQTPGLPDVSPFEPAPLVPPPYPQRKDAPANPSLPQTPISPPTHPSSFFAHQRTPSVTRPVSRTTPGSGPRHIRLDSPDSANGDAASSNNQPAARPQPVASPTPTRLTVPVFSPHPPAPQPLLEFAPGPNVAPQAPMVVPRMTPRIPPGNANPHATHPHPNIPTNVPANGPANGTPNGSANTSPYLSRRPIAPKPTPAPTPARPLDGASASQPIIISLDSDDEDDAEKTASALLTQFRSSTGAVWVTKPVNGTANGAANGTSNGTVNGAAKGKEAKKVFGGAAPNMGSVTSPAAGKRKADFGERGSESVGGDRSMESLDAGAKKKKGRRGRRIWGEQ